MIFQNFSLDRGICLTFIKKRKIKIIYIKVYLKIKFNLSFILK